MNAELSPSSKSKQKVTYEDVEPQSRKRKSSSLQNCSPKRKKPKDEKKKRKKRDSSSESSSVTDSSLSSNSSSSSEKRKKRKKRKHKKEKKKKVKREKEKKKKKEKKRKRKHHKEVEIIGPVLPEKATKNVSQVDLASQTTSKSMAPMTKEEWEKRQSVVRRVFDEETGRNRLIKGDGEVLEEIVSKERHREINRQATLGDGAFFQSKITTLHPK